MKFRLALPALLLLAACAHDEPVDYHDRLALYRAHAGAPVDGFQYARNVRWAALGEHALAVWPSRDQGYLIELRVLCSGLDRASAMQITHTNRWVSARLDSVRVLSIPGSPPMSRPPCPILTIRPLDLQGLRSGELPTREAQPVERVDGAPGT